MSTTPRRALAHLTYANLVSTAALVVALGAGTAYAANTIGSPDLIDGDVQHVDLSATAVEGDRIVDGSVGHADLGATAVGGDRVTDGSLTLLDISGADVPTSVSVPKTRSGKCVTRKVGVSGARPGQVALMALLSTPKRGLVLSGARISGADQVAVDVCNVGPKTARASTIGVRIVTLD